MNLPAITFHPPIAVSGVEIVVVLMFVVGGLIKSFFDKAVGPGGKGLTMTTPPLVPPRPSVSSEEERARRLMEALGLPAATPPPVPLPPAAVPCPVPPPLPPPNVVVTRRAGPSPLPLALPLDPPRSMPQPVAKRRRPDPDLTLPRSPAGAGSTGQAVRPPAATTTLRGLLRTSSRAELRRAIVLREVLGPPRALAELGEAN